MLPSVDQWPTARQYHGARLASRVCLGPNQPVARKLSFVASRHGGEMLVRLLLLALAGTLIGLLLGEMIAKPLAAVSSEEHTSELQSLMRISYAVFCLTKKKIANTNKNRY